MRKIPSDAGTRKSTGTEAKSLLPGVREVPALQWVTVVSVMGGETRVVLYCGGVELLCGVEAILGEDFLRLVGVVQPFVELLRGFGGRAGLAERYGYSLRSTSVSSTEPRLTPFFLAAARSVV